MTAAPIRDLTHHTSPIARTNYTLRRVLDATGIEHAERTLPTATADQGSTARELFARFYDPGTEAFEHDGSSGRHGPRDCRGGASSTGMPCATRWSPSSPW